MRELEWRTDDYGNARQALYLGKICVGHISRIVPEQFREWKHLQGDDPKAVQRREWYEKRDAAPWRAWIMTSEDGDELSWHPTDDEARAALEVAVRNTIN